MKFLKWILGVVFLVGIIFVLVEFYPFIFSRHVEGVVVDVQKVEVSGAIMTRTTGDLNLLHSFAVAVRESSGEIVTSSAEDRQWALVKPGQCVEAQFFPYPPWDLQKGGTFHGARLHKLSDCPVK